MSFTELQKAELSKPLNKSHVRQRTQSGHAVYYIEGWHTVDEANRIFGFDGWQRTIISMECVNDTEKQMKSGKGWGVTYICTIQITVGGIVRHGTGAGHGIDKDRGLAHESAIKEAETDAMKRALMTFGNPFGLALYDKDRKSVSDGSEDVLKTLTIEAASSAESGMTALKLWWDELTTDEKHLFKSHMDKFKKQAQDVDNMKEKGTQNG